MIIISELKFMITIALTISASMFIDYILAKRKIYIKNLIEYLDKKEA